MHLGVAPILRGGRGLKQRAGRPRTFSSVSTTRVVHSGFASTCTPLPAYVVTTPGLLRRGDRSQGGHSPLVGCSLSLRAHRRIKQRPLVPTCIALVNRHT